MHRVHHQSSHEHEWRSQCGSEHFEHGHGSLGQFRLQVLLLRLHREALEHVSDFALHFAHLLEHFVDRLIGVDGLLIQLLSREHHLKLNISSYKSPPRTTWKNNYNSYASFHTK